MSKKHIQFRLPPEIMNEITLKAKALGVSENEYVRNRFMRVWAGVEDAKIDPLVVKMICRNMCITQRLVGETIEGGFDLLKDAEKDLSVIMKKIGYGV